MKEIVNPVLITVKGEAVHRYLNELAQLRLKVFREYPYLYDGTIEYEKEYLGTLARSPEGILILACDQDRVVGASTGMPLKDEIAEIKKPWVERVEDISKIYYFSESVLLKEYRGQGIGVKFFEERERWARQLGYTSTSFCAVIRDEEDFRKPDDHVMLDRFWQNRGYHKKEGCVCKLSWKQVDEPQESEKRLQFWYKEI